MLEKQWEVVDAESRANEVEVKRLEEENLKLKQEHKGGKRRQSKENLKSIQIKQI